MKRKIIKLAALSVPLAATSTIISCDSLENESPDELVSLEKTNSKQEIAGLINDLKNVQPLLENLLEFKTDFFNEEIDKLTTVQTIKSFVAQAKTYIQGLKNATAGGKALNEAISTKIGELNTEIVRIKISDQELSAFIDAIGKTQKDIISNIATTAVPNVNAAFATAKTAIQDAITSIKADILELTTHASNIISKISPDINQSDINIITNDINNSKDAAITSIKAATSTQAAEDLKNSSKASILKNMIIAYKPSLKRYVNNLYLAKSIPTHEDSVLTAASLTSATFDSALNSFTDNSPISAIDTINIALSAAKLALS